MSGLLVTVDGEWALLKGCGAVRLKLTPKTVYRKAQRKLSALHRAKALDELEPRVRAWRFLLSSNALRRATS